jgi:hypothetical protein
MLEHSAQVEEPWIQTLIWIDDDLVKTPLTKPATESGEMTNRKVIENFETIPGSTNTPPSDLRFRSYDHRNVGEGSVLDRPNRLDNFGL